MDLCGRVTKLSPALGCAEISKYGCVNPAFRVYKGLFPPSAHLTHFFSSPYLLPHLSPNHVARGARFSPSLLVGALEGRADGERNGE